MPLFVTVTPGTTVTSNTTLDASTLNLLGTPSVDVTGSVDGGSLTLGSNSVSTSSIQNEAVTEGKIASGAVTEAKIGTGAVTEGKIGSGAVTTAKLGDASSTTNGVTFGKIRQIATNSILGRVTASTGSIEVVNIGAGLSTTRNLGDISATSLVKKRLNGAGSSSDADTLTYWTSEEKTIPTAAGGNVSLVLGSGVVPTQFSCYFKCTNATSTETDAGYALGDFVDLKAVFGDGYADLFLLRVNGGTVYLIRTNVSHSYITKIGGSGSGSVGSYVTWNPANWKAVITATTIT